MYEYCEYVPEEYIVSGDKWWKEREGTYLYLSECHLLLTTSFDSLGYTLSTADSSRFQ
jgi:hypothetical protein